ncbi:hypothetical protein ALTBGP9_03139 [Alteromonas macleodii]|nr:hypothetical protein ALT831_03222 [Alteromonas macleodii]CAI3965598.1 hypothetical protein ALTBGP9_03139 [Alteromonas macleodii]CAI3965978.1 hypothetical protein ALTBGP6_03223 [Alteromonas macleodii]CAI3965982.1 hypothetical protein ALTBGP14_03222 [Alteromonas macleodii]VTO40831.1 hypothetical protein ALTBGP6_03223 [Alteromonas macleodii]
MRFAGVWDCLQSLAVGAMRSAINILRHFVWSQVHLQS